MSIGYADYYRHQWLKDNKIGSTSEKTNNISKDLFWIIIENNITRDHTEIMLDYFGADIKIQNEFWDTIAGFPVYDELVNIFEIVGKEIRSKLEERMKTFED